MKKKKTVIILTLIFVVIFAVVLIGILIYRNNISVEKKLQSGYLLEVKDNFTADFNFERVKWDEIEEESLDYLLLKNVYVEIENVEYKTDNIGTADIIITAPDLDELFATSFEATGLESNKHVNAEYVKGEDFKNNKSEINDYMCGMLKSGDYEITKTTINASITKIDQTWQIEYTDEIHGAITCYANELFEKYIEKMFKGE